jgi:hypothetical protein
MEEWVAIGFEVGVGRLELRPGVDVRFFKLGSEGF